MRIVVLCVAATNLVHSNASVYAPRRAPSKPRLYQRWPEHAAPWLWPPAPRPRTLLLRGLLALKGRLSLGVLSTDMLFGCILNAHTHTSSQSVEESGVLGPNSLSNHPTHPTVQQQCHVMRCVQQTTSHHHHHSTQHTIHTSKRRLAACYTMQPATSSRCPPPSPPTQPPQWTADRRPPTTDDDRPSLRHCDAATPRRRPSNEVNE